MSWTLTALPSCSISMVSPSMMRSTLQAAASFQSFAGCFGPSFLSCAEPDRQIPMSDSACFSLPEKLSPYAA